MNTTPYYEPFWVFTLKDRLIDLLEDREIDLKECAKLSNVSYDILDSFVNGEIEDLSNDQYQSIELSLNLPVNYFGRFKMMYEKRVEMKGSSELVIQ